MTLKRGRTVSLVGLTRKGDLIPFSGYDTTMDY